MEARQRAPGKHFPGPDFPLSKMGKVNPFAKFNPIISGISESQLIVGGGRLEIDERAS